MPTITRRNLLLLASSTLAMRFLPQGFCADISGTTQPNQSYKVAACDWMLLKRQKLGAFQLAKDCGLDGVEVDMGSLGDRPDLDNQLRDPAVRQQFLDASKATGVEICSLAMSAFYARSFADHP